MPLQELLEKTSQSLRKVSDYTKEMLKKASTLKAHPSMLDPIRIDDHGVLSPIREIANIDVPNNRTLHVTPWDKKNLEPIVKGIYAHNKKANTHTLSPENTGKMVRISLPALTEELRKEVIEEIGKQIEHSKKRVLEVRKNSNDILKKMLKEGISEDEHKRTRNAVQKLIDKFTQQIKELQQKKEAEVMKI